MTKLIDLGKKPAKISNSAAMSGEVKPSSKTYFPSFHVHDKPELNDLPAEFSGNAKFKIVHKGSTTRDGKTTHSHELEIHSIQHDGKAAKSGEGLDDALDSIEKSKKK